MLLAPIFRGVARHLSFVCLAFATASAGLAQTAAADGFSPSVDGVVMAVADNGDGKIIIAGQFANVTPTRGTAVARNNVARINLDGSVDAFDPNTNGAVRAIAVQPDGKIIIGGDFTTVGGKSHAYVARLNSNGTVDDGFTGNIGVSLDKKIALPTTPEVLAIALQGSSIVVGGTFGSASSSKVPAVQRNNLVRFTAAGELDTTFDPSPNGIVLAMASNGVDKVIIGGGFTSLTPNKGASVVRFRLARLKSDGTPDDFNPSADNAVTAIKVQTDGMILLGGSFQTLRPNGADSGTTVLCIARVDATGALDTSFVGSTSGAVRSIDVGSDGSIIIGGDFLQVFNAGAGSAHDYLARLSATGVPDNSFTANFNYPVNAVLVQQDNKVVAGGLFTQLQSSTGGLELTRNHLARVLPTGAVDTAFKYDAPGRVLTSAADSKGVVLGGTFTNIGGVTRTYLARLLPDGTIDSSYYPILNGPVYALAYDSKTDSMIVGGSFTAAGPAGNYVIRSNIARIKSDGTVDTSFDPNLNGTVTAIYVPNDGSGSMIVGGQFTAAQPNGATTAVGRAYILKLDTSGNVDTTFNPSANGPVLTIVKQSDGKLLIGGAFSTMQPGASGTVFSRTAIARLNADGSMDRSYGPVISGRQVNAIVLQNDGKAVIAGNFNYVLQGGTYVSRNSVARLNPDGSLDTTFDPNVSNPVLAMVLQSDGKIIIGGPFSYLQPNGATSTTTAYYVARLNTDGTLDTGFNLGLNQQFGNRVDFLAQQSNGDVYVGGTFTSAQPTGSAVLARNHFLKINAAGAVDPNFSLGAGGAGTNYIDAISLQPDAEILVGGKFKDVDGAAGPNIARFGSEGVPDFAFNSALQTNDAVNAIAIRPASTPVPTQLSGLAFLNPDGTLNKTFAPSFKLSGHVNAAVQDPATKMIYLGGVFSVDLGGGTTVNLIRVSPTGALDSTFKPVTITGVSATVFNMQLEPTDGKLVIWGPFGTVNGSTRNYIARLNTDGTLDAFDPEPDGPVEAVLIQSDGHMILGGTFQTFKPVINGTAATTATSRAYLARVDASGNIDTNFNPAPSGAVYSIVQQADNKIIVAGNFTTINPAAATTAPTRNFIARLNSDLTLDPAFDPSANGPIYAVALQSTQKILVGGQFSSIGAGTAAVHRGHLARLNTDGTVDTAFNTSAGTFATSNVSLIRVESDDSIVIGGAFNNVTSASGVITTRSGLAHLAADGTLDTTFNPALDGDITGITVLGDNSVVVGGTFTASFPVAFAVIGGSFTTVAGQPANYLAEINADGSFVGTFHPNPNHDVNAILPLKGGQLLIGGNFDQLGTSSHRGLARIAADGTVDESFNPPITSDVASVMIQPADDFILVGTKGDGLIRLKPDGTLDASFHTVETFAPAVAIAVQPDGKILAAGAAPGGGSRVLRLNSTGSTDAVLLTTTGTIQTLTLENDGAVIVAGSFTATVDNQQYKNVVRITPDAHADTSFNPAPDAEVDALALQADGRLLLGGHFNTIAGQPAVVIGRVGALTATPQVVGVTSDGKTFTWVPSSNAGAVTQVSFEVSTDEVNWSDPVYAAPVGDGKWQLQVSAFPASTVPTSGNYFIRARAIVPTSAGKSTGAYESITIHNNAVASANVVRIIGPVVTSVPWDQAHYVWALDASGTIRIVDAMSLVAVDASQTVLVNGGGVGSNSSDVARLANLSTRGVVGSSSPLIGGFSIVGTASRQVLIRGVGPGLAPFNVPNYVSAPQLVLRNGNDVVLTKSGWDSSLSATFTRLGAFPFTPGSTDAAVLLSLAPGTYTVQLTDGAAIGGDAMIEVYDAGDVSDTSAHLANLSARATVSSSGSLISGLVVTGPGSKTMLVRGIGPALSNFGVGGVLNDPIITVYNGAGAVMGTNDNWSATTLNTVSSAGYANSVSAAANAVGAFPLAANSADAAVIVTLQPGVYTVQLRGADGGSGAGLIELYELP